MLQDLGFHIEESVRELGFLRAAKERSAREHGQEIWRAVALILSAYAIVQAAGLDVFRWPNVRPGSTVTCSTGMVRFFFGPSIMALAPAATIARRATNGRP